MYIVHVHVGHVHVHVHCRLQITQLASSLGSSQLVLPADYNKD